MGKPRHTIEVEGVALHLAHPDEISIRWIGQHETMKQLLAAWSVVHDEDLPMNPRLLGKPGVGKTDTRPEDQLITPFVDKQGSIRYVASPLVTAMIRGGVAILDEGNRMSEKSWASLAPLLDNRRYVESIVAGVKVHADPGFRMVATMNDDASTYELPEYIHSRLQPQIHLDFPEHEEEKRILQENLPFSDDRILEYVTRFLQAAHATDEPFTVRDGVNVARYALKLLAGRGDDDSARRDALSNAITRILGEEALRHLG